MSFSHDLFAVSSPSPALLSAQHTSLTSLTAAPMMPCCVYAFTLSSLCWLLACCLFLFLLSVFSCTALHWGGPLHPLPIPVCSPRTLLPCFHSVTCLISLPFHPPSNPLAILDWFWLLWAEKFEQLKICWRNASPCHLFASQVNMVLLSNPEPTDPYLSVPPFCLSLIFQQSNRIFFLVFKQWWNETNNIKSCLLFPSTIQPNGMSTKIDVWLTKADIEKYYQKITTASMYNLTVS